MKKLLLGILFLTLINIPAPTMADVHVGISISLPPLILFHQPPELIVVPETYVYVVPDIEEEIFFYSGWWWRPWRGHWYRSREYNSGWKHYRTVPSFYRSIPSDWRDDYRHHRWRGHSWNHHRIPHYKVQKNWKQWENNRYWEKEKNWGVHGLQPTNRTQPYEKNHKNRQYREEAQPKHYRPQPQADDFQHKRLYKNQNSTPQYRDGEKHHSKQKQEEYLEYLKQQGNSKRERDRR